MLLQQFVQSYLYDVNSCETIKNDPFKKNEK
jgi:hypothetical protein